MKRRQYFLRGVFVAGGMVLCAATFLLVLFGLSYDGKCGGFLPALAGPKPCSFFEYVFGNALLSVLLLMPTYWPLVLAVLVLPPLVGHLLDRRASAAARPSTWSR